MTVATDGLNTRFDLYRGAFSQCNTDANYPPAPNVRKGMIPGNGNNGACNPNYPNPQSPYPPTADGNQAMGFPLDNNMLTNGSPNNNNGNGQWTCGDITASVTGVITSGNGNNATVTLTVGSTTGIFNGIRITDQTVSSRIPADTFVRSVPSSTTVTIPGQGVSVQSGDSIKLNGYWSTEHPPGTSGANNAPSGCTAAATISRASVYQYEIDNNYLNDASYNNGQPGGEVGAPRCSTAAAVADRRFLNVAVLNCLNLANENYSLQGSASNLPVAAFAKFFLTLPVKNASGAVYAEYQGIVTPGSGGGDFYSQVQLYR